MSYCKLEGASSQQIDMQHLLKLSNKLLQIYVHIKVIKSLYAASKSPFLHLHVSPARFSRLRLSRPYHLRGRPRRRWSFSQLRLRVALQGHRLGLGRLSLRHLALQALGRRCFGRGRLVEGGEKHGGEIWGQVEMAENRWMITGVI